MRILHIDPDDIESPWSGGGPVRTFEIYRRLAKRHEITVLTPTFPGSDREKTKEGVRYVRVGRRWGNHNSSHFISFYFAAPFAARRFKYDLLVEDLMPPTAATVTPLLNRGPIVASVQWFFAKEWSRHYHLPFHWYQPLGLKFYSKFIVLTDDSKEEIRRYHPGADIRVIPNGLDASFFEYPSTDPGDYILFLGRVSDHDKGLDLLLEAFSQIVSRTQINLVIAGDGMDLEKNKERVKVLGLQGRVEFKGRQNYEEKRKLLARSCFVCVPSRFETYCMVALEAFATAKTVVAFDIPRLDVVKSDFAFRVPCFNTEIYAKILLDLAQDPEKARALGLRAREAVRPLVWDRLALEQESFYKEVLHHD